VDTNPTPSHQGANNYPMKFFITGTRRGIGKFLSNKLPTTQDVTEADVFINCKHDGFEQVRLLYEAAKIPGIKIINISSNSGDGIRNKVHPYAVEKIALDAANEQLFYQGVDTISLRFGYIDTDRVAHINEPKMSLDYIYEVVEWILIQPHRIKELTIIP